MRRVWIVGAALFGAVLCSAPVAAQDASPEHGTAAGAEAQRAITRLRSPVTPSHTLEICPDPRAEALRDSVRVMASAGRTAEEIVDVVAARHGEQMRIFPKASGAGLWAWLATPAVVLAGLAYVVGRMRRAQPAPIPVGADPLSAEDQATVDAALREWQRVEAPR